MKITKTKLKQIIMEEIEKGEAAKEIGGKLPPPKHKLNEIDALDPSTALVIAAIGKMAFNFSPAVLGTIAIMAARKAMGLDDPEKVEQVVRQTAAEVSKGPPPGTEINWSSPPRDDMR
tara:strand:+ start:1823 stop:2176 length:354 start_codon:yes stop_codon:yes gene_type:complete